MLWDDCARSIGFALLRTRAVLHSRLPLAIQCVIRQFVAILALRNTGNAISSYDDDYRGYDFTDRAPSFSVCRAAN